MKITIDEQVLEKAGLTLEEFLILFIHYKNVDINVGTQSLLEKGLIQRDLFNTGKMVLSDNSRTLVEDLIIGSEKSIKISEESLLNLASKMREIYPVGRKPGTTYMWRGNTAEIAKRLKTLIIKYHCDFNPEEILAATESYVKSFNGDYTKMRLLKYFIYKSERDADDNTNIVSELASILENKGEEISQDWTTTLI